MRAPPAVTSHSCPPPRVAQVDSAGGTLQAGHGLQPALFFTASVRGSPLPRAALRSYTKAIRDLVPGAPAPPAGPPAPRRPSRSSVRPGRAPAGLRSRPTPFPPAGTVVATDVMSEHAGSAQLGAQSLINTRVTGVPREKLSAVLRALVRAARWCLGVQRERGPG